MKRLITLLALIIVAIVSMAADRTAVIKTDQTTFENALTFSTSDTICESDTVYIDITSLQKYPSMQDVYIVMDTVTATAGTPNVEVKLYGKCFEGDSYTYIGDSVVWTMAVADTPMKIQTTTSNRYRYFRLEFITDATDQLSYIESVEFKQWFAGIPGTSGALSSVTSLTMSNGLTIDNAVNNTLEFNENSDEYIWTFGSNTITASSGDVTLFDYGTINLGTDGLDLSEGNITNGGEIAVDLVDADGAALTIGDNDETVAINSSDWDIGATGIMTGIGNITSDGDIIATGGDFTGCNGNFIDIGEAADGTITLGRDDTGTITLTSVDDDANAAFTVSAGGTGALTLGDAGSTTAITSSDWAIDATGIATNMGTYNGLTIANSIGRLVTTATANADSTVAGSMLAAADQFVVVTSAAATNCITLPAASANTIGMVIEGYVGANGFDLRVATAQAATVKLNDVTTSVEAAIPATSMFRVVCVSATDWILTATTELGAVITAIVPDAIE